MFIPPIIETKRLIIRPFTIDDIDPSFEMNLDAEVSKYTADGGAVSREEIERRIVQDVFGDYKKYGYGRMAVELKSERTFIGFAGLKYLEDLKDVDLGYRLMRKYWGKGIATEAGKSLVDFGFNTLALTRIIALVLPENIGSIKVLQKLGFEYEKDLIEGGYTANMYVILNQ